MNAMVKSSKRLRITLVVGGLFVALGLLFWKPLLIAYHRDMMVAIWQTEMGISQRPVLGLPGARTPNPRAAVRAFSHREALVQLGYFTKKRFTIRPVAVGTAEYQKLFDKVSAESGQQPVAQFDYDQLTEPRRVSGLIVYATPSEMSRWEHFITTATGD